VARYAAHELGVKHILIDSLMKVVSAPDDYAEQKKFVGDLGAVALAEKCHVHLVAHARKGRDEREGIDKWSVKGASEITDQADNVLLVSKKAEPEEGQPDQWLEVAKQRDGAFEGTFGLFFNADSLAFGESPDGRWPMVNVGDLS
jgi:twinkle protein